jgi:hypothetical protein
MIQTSRYIVYLRRYSNRFLMSAFVSSLVGKRTGYFCGKCLPFEFLRLLQEILHLGEEFAKIQFR